MREDYWVVTDEEVVGKTGQNLAYWTEVLTAFGAEGRKSGEVVDHLQSEFNVPRYWARTLTTRYQKGLR